MDFTKRLEIIMSRLRSKKGCPWDKRQNHKSLRPYLLEEAYETLEAIETGDSDHLREELGDLFLQVVFHAQIAKENGNFSLQDVAKAIGDKLVRRHPHVFGKSSRRIDQINRKWEEIKRVEKPKRKSVLDGLPKSLPALLRTQRMLDKTTKPRSANPTRKQGKVWKYFNRILRGNIREQEKAAGKFLFEFVRVAQQKGIHAEMALRQANSQYEKDYRLSENSKKLQS